MREHGGWTAVRLLVLVAAIGTMGWVAEGPLGSPLPSRTAYVSELFAQGQPWALTLRTVDGTAGAALALAALLAWRIARTRWHVLGVGVRRLLALGIVGLALFGLSTLGDAFLPMSCTPSVSRACRLAEAAGEVPLRHRLHTATSSLAVAGAVVGFAALTAALWWQRRAAGPQQRAPRPLLLVTGLTTAYLLVTAWGLVEIAAGTPGSPLEGAAGVEAIGWSQRLQITLSALGLATVALLLPDAAATRAPRPTRTHRDPTNHRSHR